MNITTAPETPAHRGAGRDDYHPEQDTSAGLMCRTAPVWAAQAVESKAAHFRVWAAQAVGSEAAIMNTVIAAAAKSAASFIIMTAPRSGRLRP